MLWQLLAKMEVGIEDLEVAISDSDIRIKNRSLEWPISATVKYMLCSISKASARSSGEK